MSDRCYRRVDTGFWTDPDPVIEAWSCDQRLVYLYALTHPEGHVCGVFRLSPRCGDLHCGLPRGRVLTTLPTLAPKLYFDNQTGYVWIPAYHRHQVDGPGAVTAALRRIDKLSSEVLLWLHSEAIAGTFERALSGLLSRKSAKQQEHTWGDTRVTPGCEGGDTRVSSDPDPVPVPVTDPHRPAGSAAAHARGLPLFPSNAASPPASTPEAPKKKRRSRNDPAPPESPVRDEEITPELRCVWEWYVVRRKRPKGSRPTRKALDAFRAREAEGYDVATMRAAIAGVGGHDYFGRPGNDNFAFLFGDAERVEQLASAGRQVLAAEERDKQMWTPTATLSKEAQEHKRIREMAEEMRRQSAATPWPKAEEAA